MTTAPAPASDAVLAAAPPFILHDTWDDAEWRAVAAMPAAKMTEAQKYLYAGGPRPNPWGAAAVSVRLPDGKMAWFPSSAAYQAFTKDAAETAATHEKAALGALNQLNKGLAAAATTPGEARLSAAEDKLEAAAPHGSVAG